MRQVFIAFFLLSGLLFPFLPDAEAQGEPFAQGSPSLREIWVNPQTGDDGRSGNTREQALRSLTAAWNRIPSSVELGSQGFLIRITPGELPASAIPNYWEHRWGSDQAPIIIEASDGPGTVTLRSGPNVFDTRYLILRNLALVPEPAGDAFHCERCDHLLLKGNHISGGSSREAQETVKINQSQYVYLEDNDIHGAHDNAVDFVSVQHGHVVGNKIHDAEDWCIYTKGGSSDLRIERNEIFTCGTGGYTAGQGTGLEYIDTPWLHYEAYDIKFANNLVHDTEGAGIGVNGGYNILLAYNTLTRVGRRSHGIEVVFGERSCDGLTAQCSARVSAGGWGPDRVGVAVPIPNRNVFIFNNLLYNPPGIQSAWQHFAIYGPRTAPSGSNVPSPAKTDNNLRIQGNVIWNGLVDLSLGIGSESGCADENPTCNQNQLSRENRINSFEPDFVQYQTLNLSPGPALGDLQGAIIPDFLGDDRELRPLAPLGNLSNVIDSDYAGIPRNPNQPRVGALLPGSEIGTGNPPQPTPFPSATSTPSPPTPTDMGPILVRVQASRGIFSSAGGRQSVTIFARRSIQGFLLTRNSRTGALRRFSLRAYREGRDGVRRFTGTLNYSSNRLNVPESYEAFVFLRNRYGDLTSRIAQASVSARRRGAR